MPLQSKYVVGIGPPEACTLLPRQEMDFLIDILDRLLKNGQELEITYFNGSKDHLSASSNPPASKS